ncbi:phage host specificity protein [Escherichia coli O145:H28]|nr:phage host specificity protein [Escherichia coli O145:H28]
MDNGASFEPQSGTLNSVIPPAVQHLTVEVSAADGQYLAQAKWDTPRVVKGVRFSLRLTSGSGEDSRLVTTAITADTEHRFSGLPLGEYTLTVRAINSYGQQGEPATTTFRINAPAAPAGVELTPGYFQITAVPKLTIYDPTVQFEFWFSEAKIADAAQVETSARYLGTGSQWSVSGPHIKPGKDFWFYVRSVNLVGKSAFVEASGRASNDAAGYLELFREKIGKTHLAEALWAEIDNSQLKDEMAEMQTTITETRNEITQTVSKTLEDQSATIQQIQRVQKDTNDDLAALYMLKVQKTKDGIPYVAGIGAGIEDTDGQPLSNILLLADRIAMINPESGHSTPLFVAQGNQLFMNDVFLKRLFSVSITSSGNPPAFSLTPDGRLTAKNADISGSVNANSGTPNNVTINENCQIKGKLSANQIEGDIVKTVSKSFPRTSTYASGTITVRISDDQKFDRQVMIPPVLFRGGKHENFNSNNQQSYWYSTCRLRVTRNGQEIFNQSTTDVQGVFSSVIDMLSAAICLAVSGAPAWASEQQATLSAGYLHARTNAPGSDNLNGINVKYRYEFTDTLGMVTSFSYAGDRNRQLTRYSDTRWHEDSVRNRWFSVMAGPSVRVNEWFSAYAMAGVAYSRVSTFSGDYLRVTDNKGKTHDVLTGSDDGRHSNTSLAWGAGVQFNPTESVAIDIAYEGSGSGDWRTDGFIVGVGYKF